MTLSPKLGVVGISTLWHFRLQLPIQMFIKVASSPRLSGIGMASPILWSHPLKMQRIVLLSSLLWWELGTNSLITGPGEWLSFRRFTSKLSWSWWRIAQLSGVILIFECNGLYQKTRYSYISFGPRQANWVLIANASSEGSGEPAHARSLARTSAARSYKQWVKRNLQTESQIPVPAEWLGMRS